MLEAVCAIFSLIWFFGSVIFVLIFSMIADQDNKTILQALKDLTFELFLNKNWFGVSLSVFICIILIPSYMFALLIKIICVFCNALVHIWELGKKREHDEQF